MLITVIENEKRMKEEAEREEREVRAHNDLVLPWLDSLEKGLLTGKVFSQRTIGDYRVYVERFLQQYPRLSVETLRKELGSLPPERFATREKVFKALVCFGKYLVQERCLDEGFLIESKPLCPKRHKPPRRTSVDDTGLEALLNACETPLETLIITLLANTGIRASEACQIRPTDVDIANGCLFIRHGKGGKDRKVGLSTLVIEAIQSHLAKTLPQKYLLEGHKGQPLTRHALHKRIQRIAMRVDITAYPHALRRSFVTRNANMGRPLVLLQKACGHENIKTTMSYCMTTEQDVVTAMKEWY
jgi:integrase